MSNLPDTLIMTFAPGGSLTRWADLGRLDRETHLLRGLLGFVPHLIFVSDRGARDTTIAAELSETLAGRVDAIAINQPDPELGPGRPLHDRVLARLGQSRRVVIQTMQLEDNGVSRRILGPLRRAGVQAALVARGGFIRSRVLAALRGPHAIEAVRSGVEEHALCQQAQLVVGVSDSTIDELCWRHGINPARTRVIPHFVHDLHEPVGPEDRDRGLILAVGEVSRTSGVETMILAFERLSPERRGNARLLVIGDGPERARLAALAREHKAPVEFAGRVPYAEVQRRMNECALFLHASSERRQSRSVLEAMATGAPVVVADTPEFDGVVENGSTGLRVKPSPDSLAFGIENLLSDADWRGMLGSSGARRVRTRCDLQAVLDRTREAYADALALAPGTVQPRARKTG